MRISDPGVKKAPDTGSGSATLVTCTAHPNIIIPVFKGSISYFFRKSERFLRSEVQGFKTLREKVSAIFYLLILPPLYTN
jgi:hypothetical protein